MLIFKKKPPLDGGFTMVGVLTGMLMTTLFLSTAMQVLFMGTLYRVNAQQAQKANFWIQEDIERVRLIASRNLAQNNQQCNPSNYDGGYAKALADALPATAAQTLFKKNYRIDRIYDTASSVAPHKVLKINYEVKEWNGTQFIGNSIATNYVEVTPDAALLCY